MIELRRLSVDDGMDVYLMLQEIPKEENGLINSANGLSFEEYKQWLKGRQANAEQIGLVDGWKVPSTTYWLYADGEPVGFGSVRHFLTDALRRVGGSIGYGIAPKHRGKGYGKEMLRRLLEEAGRIGMDRALLTIHRDNAASKAVALANGGVIAEQTDERIYVWIDLTSGENRMNDEALMRRAIELSKLAVERGNESFGAVLAKDGEIVFTNENQIYTKHDPTFHAEAGLIREFCAQTGTTDLHEYTMYASCEPCFMCSGAMVWVNLGRLVYGASNTELENMLGNEGCNCSEMVFEHSFRRPKATGGVLREESLAVLKEYFAKHAKG